MMKSYQVPGEGGSPESVSLGSSPVTVSVSTTALMMMVMSCLKTGEDEKPCWC